MKLKKNQFKKALKTQQKTIKKIRTKIKRNTNCQDTFNFLKSYYEIRGKKRKKKEEKKSIKAQLLLLYEHTLNHKKKILGDLSNFIMECSI